VFAGNEQVRLHPGEKFAFQAAGFSDMKVRLRGIWTEIKLHTTLSKYRGGRKADNVVTELAV
jgi:hypothetical protein